MEVAGTPQEGCGAARSTRTDRRALGILHFVLCCPRPLGIAVTEASCAWSSQTEQAECRVAGTGAEATTHVCPALTTLWLGGNEGAWGWA